MTLLKKYMDKIVIPENIKQEISARSDMQYDEGEFFSPGEECLDGTVERAMLAGIKAYPF